MMLERMSCKVFLFRNRFPGIAPEDYYAYAYKEVHGDFPPIGDKLY